MGTLSGNTPAATFQKLLKTEPAVNDTTLRTVESGAGVTTPLQLSTNKVKVAGDLEVTGTLTTSSTNTFSVVGPSPTLSVVANDGNVATIDLGDTTDPSEASLSYDNAVQEAVINVAGQSAASALRLSSTHLTTDKVVRTTSILTGLDSATNNITATSYIHVFETTNAVDVVSLPSSPVTGDTYLVSNSGGALFGFDNYTSMDGILFTVAPKTIGKNTAAKIVCVDGAGGKWIYIGD